MPIKIQNDLPVKEILENENLFVVDENRAIHQDIRPLQLCILNLMPKKEETELQLLRMLSNTPLQIDVTFMRMSSHQSLNTPVSSSTRTWTTGLNCVKSSRGARPMCSAPSISAGARRRRCITTTDLRSVFFRKNCSASTPIKYGTEKNLLSGDLTITSSSRTAATQRFLRGPSTHANFVTAFPSW